MNITNTSHQTLGFWQSLFLIYVKDTKSEWRSPFFLFSSFLFSIIIVTIYSHAIDPAVFKDTKNFDGILLVTLFFSATLSNLSAFRSETEEGALHIINMSVLDTSGIYLAKLLVHWKSQMMLIIVSIPIYFLFLKGNLEKLWGTGFYLLICLAMCSLSLASLAVLISHISQEKNFQIGLIMPLLLLPASIPVLLLGLSFLTEARKQLSLTEISFEHYLLLLAPVGLYGGIGSLLYSKIIPNTD